MAVPDHGAYLTVEEAAERARCVEKTVRRAVSGHQLQAFRVAGRILITEEALRGWIESTPAAASAPRRQRLRPVIAKASGPSRTIAALKDMERRGPA